MPSRARSFDPPPGNHAAALALVARDRGIPAHIVSPRTAPAAKLAAVRAYGGDLTLCEPAIKSRKAALAEVQQRTGACYVPPSDAVNTMLGQGTVFLEVEEQAREGGWGALGAIIAPVGGAGLLGGIAVAARGTGVRVFGAGASRSSSLYASRKLLDGTLTMSLSCRTRRSRRLRARTHRRAAHHRVHAQDDRRRPVDARWLAQLARRAAGRREGSDCQRRGKSDSFARSPSSRSRSPDDELQADARLAARPLQEIIDAQRLLWQRLKTVVEPSGAVAFALARSGKFRELGVEGPVCVVLSGGNVDLDVPPPWIKS